MSFDILPAPGLITDDEHPSRPDGTAAVDLRELVALGYEWISYQLVNGAAVNPQNIDIGKYGGASGFKSCGCWGVVYDVADFRPFGERLGREAVRQDAEHVIVDAEECSKYTDDDQGMKPIIDGLRDGGWTGAVHLCPLGCPTNAVPYGPNDYHCDTKSYLDTGGGVIPQAYYNAHANYRPDLCVDYWTAIGVPADRLNIMIELAFENSKIVGAEWSKLLDDANVGRGFSVYMVQHGTDEDWAGLEPHSAASREPPAPQPEPEDEMEPVTDQMARAGIGIAAQASMQNYTDPKPRGRVTTAWRTVHPDNSDELWNTTKVTRDVRGLAVRDAVQAIYDDAGLPAPS